MRYERMASSKTLIGKKTSGGTCTVSCIFFRPGPVSFGEEHHEQSNDFTGAGTEMPCPGEIAMEREVVEQAPAMGGRVGRKKLTTWSGPPIVVLHLI
jgi:hypothetical protein